MKKKPLFLQPVKLAQNNIHDKARYTKNKNEIIFTFILWICIFCIVVIFSFSYNKR